MLATITVSTNADGAIDSQNSNVTLREAIAFVNGVATPSPTEFNQHIVGNLGENDAIVFASGVNGQTITVTGGNLVVTKQVTITGPVGPGSVGGIRIQKGAGSTATAGFQFSSFDLSPVGGFVTAQTGVSKLTIAGFDKGIEVSGLRSTNFSPTQPLKITLNTITDVVQGIAFTNANIPFHIESNVITGRSTAMGLGIIFNNSGQFLPSGAPITSLLVKPTIGNESGAGNVIGNFFAGIRLTDSFFPDLRISGNRIGADADFNPIPNGTGMILEFANAKVGRIDHNDIVYNFGDGIIVNRVDGLLIENNLIGANGGDGIDLSVASGNHTIRNNTFDSNGDNGTDGDGVTIHPLTSGTEASQIVISENDFLGMKSWTLPIDLGDDGQDPIDNNDFDPGVNHRQNHPELKSISFDGSSWILGIKLDVGGNVMGEFVRFEFYRYNSALKNYHWIRSITDEVPEQADYENAFYFSDGADLSVGDGIAMIAVVTSGPFINDTSEMSPPVVLALPGDYNRNGTVDAADYTVWRSTLNATGLTPYAGADGNGDGMITVADYAVWKNNFGNPAGGGGFTPGDYNEDHFVDAADRDLWLSLYGETTDLRADGNYNGIVDLADLQVWREMFGVTTLEVLEGDFNVDGVVDTADYDLWCAGEACADADGDSLVAGDMDDFHVWEDNFGLVRADVFPLVTHGTNGKPLEIPGIAPVVLGVAVGAFDFAGVVGSGEQLRSMAAVNPNTVSIRFSEEVFVTSGALTVTNLDGAPPASVTSFVYDLATQTATWTFNAPLADGRILLRLSDSLFDLDHEALDGEFLNPISLGDADSATFPSGDGDAGGEFRFRFTVLAGDTDHNNIDGATNYQNWQSTEPGMIIVSTTADEYDGSLSFGDVSLREAVNYANTAGAAMAIQLPSGRYLLTRVGTEDSGTSFNDLDIAATVTIIGDGAGLSIIDSSGQSGSLTLRAFDVKDGNAHLTLRGVTIAHGVAASDTGLAVRVNPGGSLALYDSALVHHTTLGGGSAIYVDRGNLTIRRSVITTNRNQVLGGAAVQVRAVTGAASVTIGESVFALNSQYESTQGGGINTTINVQTVGNVTKTNEGRNLYDNAGGGFFNVTPGVDDHLGVVQYVVTSVADTFNHADDNEALSIREAVDLANQAAGQQTIWIPAWKFVLTRDRGSLTGDVDVAFGDLDIKDSVIIRGVMDRTNAVWKPGIVDEVFDLLGDFNAPGEADANVVSTADYAIWQLQNGSSGAYGQYSADADDDGDVDSADYTIATQNVSHTLQLFDLAL